MKREKVNKALLVAGLLCMASTNLIQRFLKLPDPGYGFLFGISAGIIILSIVRPNKTRRVSE